MRVVFFNGPPKSGKSTAARILARLLRARDCKRVYELHVAHLADKAKEMVHRAYDIDTADLWEKDTPQEDLFGATPRQAYVAFIQGLISIHGAGVLGTWLANKYKHTNHKWLLVPDLGRPGDMNDLCDAKGAHNCCIIRMHRLGCNYDADRTRGYVERSGLKEFDLINDGDESRLESTLACMLEEELWFARRV